ncbi:MAG: hypothetical protein H6750_17055 [Nitrospiraceae bacterium]|nr:hypothetical protein [Nitrospira sp.]MCA9455092.1 hypothetical protein [Nitrospira sp.]MCB9776018.1 hypothetical protein [Nitrospiraceae bacterium]
MSTSQPLQGMMVFGGELVSSWGAFRVSSLLPLLSPGYGVTGSNGCPSIAPMVNASSVTPFFQE